MFTRTAIGHRRSIRLPDFDYTEPGAYFVTLCTRDRRCVFGEVTQDVEVADGDEKEISFTLSPKKK